MKGDFETALIEFEPNFWVDVWLVRLLHYEVIEAVSTVGTFTIFKTTKGMYRQVNDPDRAIWNAYMERTNQIRKVRVPSEIVLEIRNS